MLSFGDCLNMNPCIAILRGLDIRNASDIGDLIYQSGIRCIEVPLNKPDAIECIEKLVEFLPEDCSIGAGTVVNREQVDAVATAGVNFIVAPNTSKLVIEKAISRNMVAIPGVGTVTEAYTACEAGAKYLKLFPAISYGITHLKAMVSVLPQGIQIIPVGGVHANNLADWLQVGATGIGIGNDLYQSGDSTVQVKSKLEAITSALSNYNERSHKVTK